MKDFRVNSLSFFNKTFGGLCVVRINVTKNKLHRCHGYLLEQNAN